MYPLLSYKWNLGSYSFLLLLGYFSAYVLSRLRAKENQIEGRHVDNLALMLIVFGLAGATVFGRLFYGSQNISLWNVLNVLEGGPRVLYGGIISGTITVILYSFVMRVPLGRLGDLIAPSLALGIMFGRIGCFLAGCCWGDVCLDPKHLSLISNPAQAYQVQTIPFMSTSAFPFSVTFPKNSYAYVQHLELGLLKQTATHSIPVHPVQIYEAVFCLALCIFLIFRSKKKKASKTLFLDFCIGYAFIRFLMEFLRAGNSHVYWGITVSQVISLIVIGVCILLYYARIKIKQQEKKLNG